MEGNVIKRKNEDQILENNKRRSINKFFSGSNKEDFLKGFFDLTLEWILKAILVEDGGSKTSTKEISNAVLQSFSPGELLNNNYLGNFYSSFHRNIENLLIKMFPHQKERWNLKVSALNIIPQNMNIHWIHYFASMSSRGYKIEDLINAPEEEDDDDSFFEEVILQKSTTEKHHSEDEKSNTIKGYSEVSSKWKTFDPKLLLKSIESLAKIKTSKTGKVRTPPGAQSSSSTAKTSIDKVVTFIKDLFAGDLKFAFQVLSLNEQFKSCLLSFVEENKLELVSELNDVKKEFENLKHAITKLYYVEDRIIRLVLRYINGDNKAIWATLSNKMGGNLRCWGCTARFDTHSIKKNFFFHHFQKYYKKGLKENFLVFLNAYQEKLVKSNIATTAKECGLSSSPYFAEALYHCFIKANKTEKEFLDALNEVMVGVDNLHNIRGWILHLISCLKESGRLNEKKFNQLLEEHDLSPKDCNGDKLRYLMLNYETIIIPSLVYDKKTQKPITDQLRKVLSIFQTITWVAYAPEDAQSYNGIKLLLRYKCFELSQAAADLNDLKLMDLYLHVILSHFPDFFDKCSFQVTSTEPLEALFITVKRCKHSTSRDKLNILKTIIKRFENKEQILVSPNDPNSYLQAIMRTENVKKENKFSSYREVLKQMEDIKIEIPPQDDPNEKTVSLRAFIESIKTNTNYSNHLEIGNGSITLKVKDDINKFLSLYD